MSDPIDVVFQGEPGAFSEEAVLGYFGDGVVRTAVPTWRAVFDAVAGVEPYASHLKAKPDDELPILQASEINIVVTGGETQGAWRIYEATRAKDATVSIDAWR